LIPFDLALSDANELPLDKLSRRSNLVRPLSSKNKYNGVRVVPMIDENDSSADFDVSIGAKSMLAVVQPSKPDTSKQRWTVGSEPTADRSRQQSFPVSSPNSYSADVRVLNKSPKRAKALLVRRDQGQSNVVRQTTIDSDSLQSTAKSSSKPTLAIQEQRVTIINRKSPKIVSRVMLNVNVGRTFDSLIKELGQCVKLDGARVLHGANGQQVTIFMNLSQPELLN
jgi:hypothetical protein